MHDYTKTMKDVTIGSKDSINEAMQQYQVNDMITSVQNMIKKGDSLLKELNPQVFEQASHLGTELLRVTQQMDFEQGKQLIQHANQWASAVDVTKLQGDIVNPLSSFLKSSTSLLHSAEEQHLIQHVAAVASNTVELEARLKRLNEITIKLPNELK
jgi:hypothetical protein